MSFIKSINVFFKNLDKTLLRYRDGFIEIPYLAGSPKDTVKSFDKMPFNKHLKKEKCLINKTIFLDGELFYHELENGLWLFISGLHFKKNLHFLHHYNKEDVEHFYFLNFNISEKPITTKKILVNGACATNNSWALFKPMAAKSLCHFKNTHEKHVTLYFNQAWLDKQLTSNSDFIKSKFQSFVQSKSQYLTWPSSEQFSVSFNEFYNCIKLKEKGYEQQLEKLSTHLFNLFLKLYKSEQLQINHFEISDEDRKKILKANQILLSDVTAKFVGIDFLAEKISMSPTKFKTLFKQVYGDSVFQYYSQKKMDYAHELLQKTNLSIREIATLVGYESHSKFSAAYEAQFGHLPSKI